MELLLLKPIDLSKIIIEPRPSCKTYCTHPDIKLGVPYLAYIKNYGWTVAKFGAQWYGLAAHCGSYTEQLTYEPKGHKTNFELLYELPNGKVPCQSQKQN